MWGCACGRLLRRGGAESWRGRPAADLRAVSFLELSAISDRLSAMRCEVGRRGQTATAARKQMQIRRDDHQVSSGNVPNTACLSARELICRAFKIGRAHV